MVAKRERWRAGSCGRSPSRGVQQAQFAGPAGRIGPRPAVKLGQDALDVHLDGTRAQEQLPGDLPVGEPGGDQADDFNFPAGQAAMRVLGCRTPAESPLRPRPGAATFGPTWTQFLPAQAEGIVACDVFTVETIRCKARCVLCFLRRSTRQIVA